MSEKKTIICERIVKTADAETYVNLCQVSINRQLLMFVSSAFFFFFFFFMQTDADKSGPKYVSTRSYS